LVWISDGLTGGKRGRGRPKIAQMEMVSKDLKSLDIEVDMFYDSDEWCKRLFHIINTEINQTKQQIPGNKLTCSI
jgi:hypothetical protein